MSTLENNISRVLEEWRIQHPHISVIPQRQDWWYISPQDRDNLPSQGWKLHISSIPTDALETLKSVGNVLIENHIHWKVAFSEKRLVQMSSGAAALSQVGKFITVYPQTEQEAIMLAEILHAKTLAFRGPKVPSDRPYTKGSNVYYRYGGFKSQFIYDQMTGFKSFYIVSPQGEKIEDRRTPSYYQPEWVDCPFPNSRDTLKKTSRNGLFGRGIWVKKLLRQSAKGGVYIVETEDGTAVLKEARYGTAPDNLSRDARDRLQNEFNILKLLEPLNIAPQAISFFKEEGNCYLLMSFMKGDSLRNFVTDRNYLGGHNVDVIRRISLQLIRTVRKCHDVGVVLRDLTPNNIMVDDGNLYLIDMELACLESTPNHPFPGFTPGYVRSGEEDNKRNVIENDFYSLGAILFFLVTGIDPYLPTEGDSKRLFELLQSYLINDELEDIGNIAVSLMNAEKGYRAEIIASIQKSSDFGKLKPLILSNLYSAQMPISLEQVMQSAILVADSLYNGADFQNKGSLWSMNQFSENTHPATFHLGTAGVAWFLCEMSKVTKDQRFYEYALGIMNWTLENHPFRINDTPAGLYFGYGAVPWVLKEIGTGLNSPKIIQTALDCASQIAKSEIYQLDITHGAAGIGLMHLELYRTTLDEEQLMYAKKLAQRISDAAIRSEHGNVYWDVSLKRTLGIERVRSWGYAHGAAGMAYFLLAMSVDAVHGDDYISLIRGVIKNLNSTAISAGGGMGLTWPASAQDNSKIWTHWCNGAAGIGSFLLNAGTFIPDDSIAMIARKAAYSIAFGNGFGSLCQCHGLAGDGDFLLQAGREFQDPSLLSSVERVVKKIWSMRRTEGKTLVWPTEDGDSIAPHFMTGYCGIYSFLLRYIDSSLCRPLTYSGLGGEKNYETCVGETINQSENGCR